MAEGMLGAETKIVAIPDRSCRSPPSAVRDESMVFLQCVVPDTGSGLIYENVSGRYQRPGDLSRRTPHAGFPLPIHGFARKVTGQLSAVSVQPLAKRREIVEREGLS